MATNRDTLASDVKGMRDTIASDVKVVLSDAESLLQQAASAGGAQARELQERAAAALRVGQAKLREIQNNVTESTKVAAKVTDDWVHTNPWTALGVAAGVGFLLGMLISRR
jgi:ElaB/YqjD/DUF883 family membrane-anchored ribosome-binding protein